MIKKQRVHLGTRVDILLYIGTLYCIAIFDILLHGTIDMYRSRKYLILLYEFLFPSYCQLKVFLSGL